MQQSLFDRLIQALDPSELIVENVTLNFKDSILGVSLSEIEIKRSPDSYLSARKKDKDKKDKKDKLKKGADGKDNNWTKADKTNALREDGKIVLKGRWRRSNRPPSPLGEAMQLQMTPSALPDIASVLALSGSAVPLVEPALQMNKVLVHQELRNNFNVGKALRHVRAED